MNVVGIIKGTGKGLSLSLNGHMDVPYSGSEDDLLYMRPELYHRPAHRLDAQVKDGYLIGVGIGNMKASLAALMVAMKAVKKSGVELQGDLIAACGCGEVGRSPIGRFQGIEYEGAGFGGRYLVTHGIHSDYAICVDNSGLKLAWVQPGIVYLNITVYGLPGGAWATGASKTRAESQNAITKMQPVIDAIQEWADAYPDRATFRSKGGTCRPTAAITSIEAGTPFKSSMRPGSCTITMIVMIPPDIKPIHILKQLREVVGRVTPDSEVDMHQCHLGYEAQGIDGLVDAMQTMHKRLYDEAIDICDVPYCSVYTDTSAYNQNGIPCVKFGLGLSAAERLKVGIDAYDMHPIADMVKGSRLYASFGVDICNRQKLD